ncbi:unnamed protein product [Hymenolepis diminuta]|uniref:Uncharacterized protein n=1 Tax=Hymenolepis diminuta TaxID=6216 RepID=A0A564YQE8_HYMDI|nr:unnamed protein product [Hymenolepis diminuta]
MSDFIPGGRGFPFIVVMMRDFTSHHGSIIPMSSSSPIRNSFSRSSIAFIAGFALGTVAGAFGVKYVSYLLSLNHRSDRLLRELESVQQNFGNRTVGSVAAEAIHDDDASDDEFFDAAGGFLRGIHLFFSSRNIYNESELSSSSDVYRFGLNSHFFSLVLWLKKI